MKTTEKLAQALERVGAPQDMIDNARAGLYDDYLSPLPFPITTLVFDLEKYGFHELAARAKNGEFDATKEEARAWSKSEKGKAIFAEFLKKGIDLEKL